MRTLMATLCVMGWLTVVSPAEDGMLRQPPRVMLPHPLPGLPHLLPAALPETVVGPARGAPPEESLRESLEHLRRVAELAQRAGFEAEADNLRAIAQRLERRVEEELREQEQRLRALEREAAEVRELIRRLQRPHDSRAAFLIRLDMLEADEASWRELGIDCQSIEGVQNAVLKPAKQRELMRTVERLVNSGGIQRLASPSVLTRDRQPATVQSGGEFPVIHPVAGGPSRVEFRPFGTSLEVEPRLADGTEVELEFKLQVSERDFGAAVTSEGVQVPGLHSRSVATRCRMPLGSTFVMSGLRSDRIDETSGVTARRALVILATVETVDEPPVSKAHPAAH